MLPALTSSPSALTTKSLSAMLIPDVSMPFRTTQFQVSCPVKYFTQVIGRQCGPHQFPAFSLPAMLTMYSLPFPCSKKPSTTNLQKKKKVSKRISWGFPGGAMVENLPANAGDTGSSPGLGRSHVPWRNWAREPQLLSLLVWSPCSAMGEAATGRGPRTAMKSGPHLPQLEKALAQKRRPNTAKNK